MQFSDLYNERLERVRRAVALDEQDRVPVVLEYASFAARATATPLPEFLLNLNRSVEVMIQAWELATEKHPADAINYGRFSPYNLCLNWMSKVAVPGVDLPAEVSYQVVEKEMLTRDDYDEILKNGWQAFYRKYLKESIFSDLKPEYLPWNQPAMDLPARWAKIDVPVLKGASIAPPFEYLCGGRTLAGFFNDLMQIPDKVIAAMDAILAETNIAEDCGKSKDLGFPAVWVGGWRTAPAMLSPDMWERFVWPYMETVIKQVIDQDVICILHLDGNWERELERFLDLPSGKMVFSLDGFTDIYRSKEILGGHSCIMGDLPAIMLFSDTPENVYEYSSRLIRDMGPKGFILHSGCDIPENAKLENVQAMVAAADA